MSSIQSVVCHHTAGAASGNYPSLNVVAYGRAGLPGPLAQLGLARDGSVYVIAAGLSYHAGAVIASRYSNSHAIGIEAESVGTRNDWTAAQRNAYPRLCAALCRWYRINPAYVRGHKEICSPAGRKIDPAYIDMNVLRRDTARLVSDPNAGSPRPAPRPKLHLIGEPMEIPFKGKDAWTTVLVAVPQNGLNLVYGAAYDTLWVNHVKCLDGNGKVLKSWGKHRVPAGNPNWNMPIPNGCVAVELNCNRKSSTHTPTVGFRVR